MCGIAGIFNFDKKPVSPVILKSMTDAIAHRGPDGEGQWAEGPVGLGHRRLAILDLSPAGRQPMQSSNGQYILTYNGEIYNYLELRTELERKGYQFHSRTDTEVLLNVMAEWGIRGLKKLNGMFAFAIWDKEKKRLILARDRYGIKPLYYSKQGNCFRFGSEQKAILADRDFKSKLNKAALLEYFTFQNIFTDQTLHEDIHLLPAGNFMVIDPSKETPIRVHQFWDFNFREPDQRADVEEYREELDRLFTQAVNRQLMTDVELGSYLSGGIDSGAITAIASKSYPYMKTFTCGFDLHSASGIELAYDERSRAEHMSYHCKTEHYEMVLKAGDMERVLPSLSYHLEEPRVGQSYPNYYAAQLASKFVKVVLSGAGGDELFGGYPWRYYRAVVNEDFEDYIDKYYLFWQRLLPNTIIKEAFAPIWDDVKHVWTRDIFRDVFKHHMPKLTRPEDYINHSLYFEAKTFLHGLLVVEDKLSMAHGLESRVPFLDNDLVDFAMQCPVDLKLNNLSEVVRINENEPGNKTKQYFQKTKDGKQIIRDVMKKYMPPEISQAEKQGFSAPDASWFKGESIEFVKETLMNNNAEVYKYLDNECLQNLICQHLNGEQNKRLLIWSLLNIELWFQTNEVEA
ncbi:MAG: asparagine synthase (glutamine-hydrolyzing) [Alphaproteobacteria bacterium]|nr:asparagine synthase (glutamine-hydrolyzing) [Alphaproteobacteria bacterium]